MIHAHVAVGKNIKSVMENSYSEWWTKRRTVLQAIVLYVVMVVCGLILSIVISTFVPVEYIRVRPLIGPAITSLSAIIFSLLICQRKGRTKRIALTSLVAIFSLFDLGAMIILILPALFSLLPNDEYSRKN